jgi:DNA-binding IclR family transcriptional regulator
MPTGRRFNLDAATKDQVAVEVTRFMSENTVRHSATRGEVSRLFNCSISRATRILNGMVETGKLKRDDTVENLYWLNLETF